MKKIIIIDGGPRKTLFNTASMQQKIAEGVAFLNDRRLFRAQKCKF